MKTFTGKYANTNFIYSDDNDALRMQLISILNTPKGSRFYYPSYGSHINEYRFEILNYFTINMIGQEIKDAVSLIDGVELESIEYIVYNNRLDFNISLSRMSNIINIKVSVADGAAY